MPLNYNKIMNFLARGNKSQFDISACNQRRYLSSLGEPRNDIERSFFQYKCQMLFTSLPKRLIFNFCSIFIIPVLLVTDLIKGLAVTRGVRVDAIVETNTHQGVMPRSVENSYEIADKSVWNSGKSLSLRDLKFVARLTPYLFRSPYFVFKLVYKISLYSYMINRYEPRAIFVFNEYSFTSSVLTDYCESRGVEHIDIMHGEKLFFIRDSFFRFTRTYIWDAYYERLFLKLRAYPGQFVTEQPPFMQIEKASSPVPEIYADYKYYLANYSEDELLTVIRTMEQLGNGVKIKYRPHPRYSDLKLLVKHVPSHQIEYPAEVGIIESIANCGCVVGCYTTVINQAYQSGIKVLLDDLNFPAIFRKLEELEYVMTSNRVKRLSEEVK